MRRLCVLLFPPFSFLAIAGLPPYLASKTARTAQIQDKLPLRFEQAAGDRYMARGPGFLLSVSPSDNRLEWLNPADGKKAEVRTRLSGAQSGLRLEPLAHLPGTVNYFVGDRANWRTNVEGWEGVRCREAYPGIDLVFHGNARTLEYDFVVKAHANPAVIKMELSGQQRLSIAANGDLVVSTAAGELRWKHPELYQDIDGSRRRVEGRFVVAGRKTVRFETGSYDESRDLIIDPTLAYSTYLGGTGNDVALAVAVDPAGNVYVSGETGSTDLPVVSAFQSAHGTQSTLALSDAFVAKFSHSGALDYLTYLGGSGGDVGSAIAVDAAGNAYVAGYTTSANFPMAGTNPLQTHYGGSAGQNWYHSGDGFVTKLNPTGDKLIYSTYVGGSADDAAMAITIDSAGDAYVAGGSASRDFPTTPGSYRATLRGVGSEPIEPCCSGPFIDPGDAFVLELDPTGSTLLFSTFVGGASDELATSIALDSSKNIYIAGYTMSNDFPTTVGALQRTWGGFEQQTPYFVTGDGFITKLNPTATTLLYSTFFGGAGDDCIASIAVDGTGALYFTGYSSTTNLPVTTGAIQKSYGGYQALPFLIEYLFGDAIVGKLNAAGSQLVYLTYLGGSQNDAGTAIAVDPSGNAFVAGFTDSSNFPHTSGALQTKWGGDGGPTPPYLTFGDGFLAMVDATGASLLYSTFLGGGRDDELFALALDGNGSAYVAGNTYSTNWPTTARAFQAKYAGESQQFDWPWGDAVYSVISGFPITPSINKVANAEGENATIAPNTWVEIKGTGLAPDTRTWLASDFVGGQMPTALDGASVTFNGEKAFTYFISAGQINVLTPPDLAAGPVQVVVTNQGLSSPPFTATVESISPSLFVFNGGPYVAATHLNGSLIGPPTLFSGSSSPASAGEVVVLYANGFGPVTPPVVSGSSTQMGNLPSLPVVRIGNNTASVSFAGLVAPGLYQFNVQVPSVAASGDNNITVSFNGVAAQPGTVITIR